MKRSWIIPLALLLFVVTYAASVTTHMFKAGTGLSVAVTDTSITYSLTASQRDIEFYLYTARNFSGGVAETAWFYNARNYYARPQTLNSTPDRFKMMLEWGSGNNDYGPATFDTVRAISTDSALVFALCRLPTQPSGEYRMILLKRPADQGMSNTRVITGGNTVVESQEVNNAVFPDSGNTTHMQLLVRTKFP